MKKIFYFFGILLVIWLVFIFIGFLSNKTEPVGVIHELPLQQNLVLFYNKDLISSPPATWQEFMDIKSAVPTGRQAAIGTADNIEYAPEILVLLMLEQGIIWPDFGNDLGERALKFYTQFADSSKKVYTWDKDRENSLQEFSQGRIGLIFAYEKDKSQFANINYNISRIPVIDISQPVPELPELSEDAKAVLAEMIESVASGRKSAEEAISQGAGLIQELQK